MPTITQYPNLEELESTIPRLFKEDVIKREAEAKNIDFLKVVN